MNRKRPGINVKVILLKTDSDRKALTLTQVFGTYFVVQIRVASPTVAPAASLMRALKVHIWRDLVWQVTFLAFIFDH